MAADLIFLEKFPKSALLRTLFASLISPTADINMLKITICMIQLIMRMGNTKNPIRPKMKLIIDKIARVSVFVPNREN